MIVFITTTSAVAFVACLSVLAIRRSQRIESSHAGSHRRQASQPPTAVLKRAIATAGTHGLGMIRKGSGS